MNETAELGRFAAEFPADSLPSDVLHRSACCLLDFLGISVGAWDEPAVKIAWAVARDLGGAEQATLLAGGGRTSLVQAATLNGLASHVLDFDDTHEPTILHGTGPIMGAALAAAEWTGASGRALLTAHAIGFEVAARVALAVHPEHYDQGFQVAATAGAVGAAAATGRVLGLDAGQMAHALSTSATQAAGLREMLGSMSKALQVGKAAGNGLYSALLAQNGWISAPEGLEGRRGYWATLSSRCDPSAATVHLGETWELRHNGFKPYPCGVVAHPTIDAMRRLRERVRIPADEIDQVCAQVNPYVLDLMGKTEPAVGLEGKFSVYHCAAIGYIDGTVGVGQFSDGAVTRPDVVALRRRVRVETNPSLPTRAAIVNLVARDGRTWREEVQHATGTPGNPMTDSDLVEKYLELVEQRLAPDRARQLASQALAAHEAADVRELIALAVG